MAFVDMKNAAIAPSLSLKEMALLIKSWIKTARKIEHLSDKSNCAIANEVSDRKYCSSPSAGARKSDHLVQFIFDKDKSLSTKIFLLLSLNRNQLLLLTLLVAIFQAELTANTNKSVLL